MFTRAGVVVALSGLAFASGCVGSWHEARYTATERVSLGESELGGATRAVIETRAGDVSLVRAEGEAGVEAFVRAETQERADATRVSSQIDGDGRLVIGVDWPDGKRRSSESCDLRVSLPGMEGVWVRSSAGDVEVTGMGGELFIETSAGDVEVERHEGSVTVVTSAGDIEISDVSGETRARTSAGDIDLVRVSSPVAAATQAGDVHAVVTGPFAGSIEAKTSVGDLRINGTEYESKSATVTMGEGSDTCLFESSVGDVRVTVSAD